MDVKSNVNSRLVERLKCHIVTGADRCRQVPTDVSEPELGYSCCGAQPGAIQTRMIGRSAMKRFEAQF